MKKIKVDDSICIGCGACCGIAPDDFKMNEQNLSEPKSDTVKNEEAAKEAEESCPVGAITIEDTDKEN